MTDLISRADAIEAVCEDWCGYPYSKCPHKPQRMCDGCDTIEVLRALPSADADGEDLIIKGAKGIQDGLYNIKDGKLFKYKAKGGTVRTYPIVPSADAVPPSLADEEKWEFFRKFFGMGDAVQGEWIHDGQNFKGGLDWCHCSECGYKTSTNGISIYRYCPNCGARMKGGDE